MAKGDTVNLIPGQVPADYHCDCDHCVRRCIGELRPADGSYYSRLERRQYYDPVETGEEGHVAKTPLHVARWLIQAYSDPGEWVLDPTIGAGTTAVEAITQGRSVAGMEVQFASVLESNVMAAYNGLLPERVARGSHTEVQQRPVIKKGKPTGEVADKNVTVYEDLATYRPRVLAAVKGKGFPEYRIKIGDARRMGAFLEDIGKEFSLVVTNPPYSGDESDGGIGADHPLKNRFKYREGLPNLAFLREGKEYWDTLGEIYAACIKNLKIGGHIAFGVKDMNRNKKPYMLHQFLNELLEGLGVRHVGTAFLKHHPTTLHINTYEKRYGVVVPRYQTISVFEKK